MHCILHQLLLVLLQGHLDTHKLMGMCVVPHDSCNDGGSTLWNGASVLNSSLSHSSHSCWQTCTNWELPCHRSSCCHAAQSSAHAHKGIYSHQAAQFAMHSAL